MKRIILALPLFLFLLVSCDKVKDPIEKKNTAVGTNFITNTNATRSNYRKVLLEDYTGHQCGNCPAAAILAHSLSAKYADTLVVIAVHAGFFTKVNPEYPTSYTCQAGNDWDAANGFGVSAVGNPNGLVNRKLFNGFALVHKTWDQTVPLAKQDPFKVKLDVTTKYDPSARALNSDIKATFLSSYNNGVKLSVVLIEDSIIGPQKDYTKNPDHVEHYEFEHMLRGAVNGSWGEDLKLAPIAANDTVRKSYTNFALDAKFNDKKVYLIAFAYDATNREVLQVEKVKIR